MADGGLYICGPGRPGSSLKRWGATSLTGFPAARDRPDPQNDRFSIISRREDMQRADIQLPAPTTGHSLCTCCVDPNICRCDVHSFLLHRCFHDIYIYIYHDLLLCLLAPICVVLVCLSAAAVRQPHRRSKGLGRSVVHACARRASRGSGARVPGARVKTPHNLYTLFAAH